MKLFALMAVMLAFLTGQGNEIQGRDPKKRRNWIAALCCFCE